jgi:hypothetical protein
LPLRHVNPHHWKNLRVREPYAFGHRNARNIGRAGIVRLRSRNVQATATEPGIASQRAGGHKIGSRGQRSEEHAPPPETAAPARDVLTDVQLLQIDSSARSECKYFRCGFNCRVNEMDRVAAVECPYRDIGASIAKRGGPPLAVRYSCLSLMARRARIPLALWEAAEWTIASIPMK